MPKIKRKVMIIGSHESVSELIAIKLLKLDYIDVTGTFNSPTAALEAAKSSCPDIVIYDTELSGKRLSSTLLVLRKALPVCRIILFSSNEVTPDSATSYRSDSIYVAWKHEHIGKLIDIVKTSSDGDKTEMPRQKTLRRPHGAANTDVAFHECLTTRELQILELIASSNTSKEIADKLRISENTVSNHRAHIMSKLSIRDLAALVRYAVRIGLVDTST